jgi:hypothetical protein
MSARASWLAVVLAILVAGAIRVRLLGVPFERDEGEYAYSGQLLLHGIPPYRLAYNMKLPGTYGAYALAMAVFGETVEGARLGLVVVNAATTLLVFFLGRRLFGALGGAASAISFAFLSLQTELLGPFGHATHYVLLPAIGGILVFDRAVRTRAGSDFFAAGLLFGVAVLMKQPGAVFPLFAACWLIFSRMGEGTRPSDLARELALLGGGTVAPVLVVVAALARAGVLDRFLFWVVTYGRQYAAILTPREGAVLLVEAASRFLPDAFLLWALSAVGVVVALSRAVGHRAFLVGFLGASFLGVCPGFYFREHYFILMLPAVAFLAGASFRYIELKLEASSLPVMPTALGVLLLACGQTIHAQKAVFLHASPQEVSRLVYGESPFRQAGEVGRYIGTHSAPEDSLVVFGSEPEIYFHAKRRSATGYIYMYGLMEEQPLALAMQEEMIREVQASRPAYVVWVKTETSWLVRPGSEQRLFQWAEGFVNGYGLCGQAVPEGQGETAILWDAASRERPLSDGTTLVVLRRRDHVPPAEGALQR